MTQPHIQIENRQAKQEDDALLYWPLNEVRTDVTCPNCGHNLRGLQSKLVSCPECGHLCDIPKLVQLQWDPSFSNVPYIRTVMAPASFLLGSLLLLLLIGGGMYMLNMSYAVLLWALPVVGVIWGFFMLRAWVYVGFSNGSIAAAYAHGFMLCMLLGLIAIVLTLALIMIALQRVGVISEVWFWALAMGAGFGFLAWWPGIRCRRRMKKLCIDTRVQQMAMQLSS